MYICFLIDEHSYFKKFHSTILIPVDVNELFELAFTKINISGKPMGKDTDTHSSFLNLFQLFTGQPPFNKINLVDTFTGQSTSI